MIQEERYLRIIDYLKVNGTATYKDLASMLGASQGTIRKDIAELGRREAVRPVRGGAASIKSDLTRGISKTRTLINKDEKQELVQYLGRILEDGESIALNGGTTAVEAAKYLANNYSKLTIVTNNIAAAEIMKNNPGFTIVLTGGIYYDEEDTVSGTVAIHTIQKYNIDLAILAVNSISLEKGVTDFRMEEVGIINAMIENAKQTAVIADHTKIGRVACMNVCSLDKISYIITDSNIDPDVADEYRNRGVQIISSFEKNEWY